MPWRPTLLPLLYAFVLTGCAPAEGARFVPDLAMGFAVSRTVKQGGSPHLRLRWRGQIDLSWRLRQARAPKPRQDGDRPSVATVAAPCADPALCRWERTARSRALAQVAP